MATESPDPTVADELTEQEREKDDQVLEREGLEQHLMQEGDSDTGTVVDGVEDEGPGPIPAGGPS